MFRECQEKDFESINKILYHTIYQIEKDTLKLNPYRKYIILEEDKIKGVLIYDKIYNRFELIYIYVDKQYRKMGYGSALMSYFINLVRRRKGINITLEVNEKNKEALKLYKKYGFEKVAVREKYYWHDNGYLMIRKM